MTTVLARSALLLLIFLLAGCGGREVREPRDGAGRPLDPSRIEVPEPRPEPRARYGNHSPYTVLGRTYHVLPSARGYRERGLASWYGSKFHGRPTSSGEPFDMYRVSAAHKTLPLPTWVEVTNLDNGRTLTIRVNDRGPFKDGRIIDLSYAAAVLLDVVDSGTARVEVRAIDQAELPVDTIGSPRELPVLIQAGAFSNERTAEGVARQLRQADIDRVRVERDRVDGRTFWRVRIGPLRDAARAEALSRRIAGMGLGPPVYVYP
ncbi:septal ring lytic transglycosylase RlpA family protein [Wenzhouxiangella sp. XN79A]|uniref:septal ring lytic transglycosylase RlpA family protein n=1 Tax=Wenzhouxiangella sp. XN79A TaxID=2724193 RepID=UPI00144AE9F3|nr:septal ring lytic transglycosylase RlpA family protein [Wenzhouxiangella sp. XN79A]NKI33959.1 septal ring lytic transglycosylase RlpA family protein [Wenzhouxiangella sp. XN79A]